jgi:hypothetical protein
VPSVRVGAFALIGVGSTVLADVPDHVRAEEALPPDKLLTIGFTEVPAWRARYRISKAQSASRTILRSSRHSTRAR